MIFVFSNAPMLTTPTKKQEKSHRGFPPVGGNYRVYAYFTTFTVFCEPSE